MATNSFVDITSILGEYSSSIDSMVKQIADEVARDAKGWRMDVEKGFGTVSATIHNQTDYQLTHLLEKPHIGKNQYGVWGTVYPKSEGHISKVQDEANQYFETEVERRIRNGL